MTTEQKIVEVFNKRGLEEFLTDPLISELIAACQPTWIPVGERLPDTWQRCYITNDVRVREGDYFNNQWHDEDTHDPLVNFKTTMWMPKLKPLPPKPTAPGEK